MSIGLGIFLGFLMLAVVVLFLKTRESPRWKKFFKWVIYGLIASIVCALGFIAYLYAKVKIDEMPKVQTSLGNVSLGDNLSDVGFKLGNVELLAEYNIKQIDLQLANSNADKRKLSKLRDERRRYQVELESHTNGSSTEIYVAPKISLLIVLQQGKVVDLQHICLDDSVDMTSTNGIYCGATSERILEKYGKEIDVLCRFEPDDDVDRYERRFSSDKFQTYYVLSKNSVSRVGVFKSDYKDTTSMRTHWKRCD